jgi:hypothetical protein
MPQPYRVQPSVDQVRSLSGTVYFDFVQHAHIIPLPVCDGATLVDVGISAFGVPSSYPLGPYVRVDGTPFHAPADVRIYIEALSTDGPVSIELTKAFIALVNAAITRVGAETAQAQYRRGMQAWLDSLSRDPGIAMVYNDALLAADRTAMETYIEAAKTKPMAELGSISAGSQGTLHQFNYLFNFILLPPVSLVELLAWTKEHDKRDLSLQEVTQPRLVWSHGPCQFYEKQISPLERSPAGGVRFVFECRYHNGLEDELDSLETIIKTRMLEIHKKIRPGGSLSDAITGTEDLVANVSVRCSELLTSLSSCAAQLQAIKSTLDGVSSKVDGLK